jgi:hypothetical protein
MNFILERAKAFVAAFAVGLVPVIIKAFETASGFDIPASWEATLLVAVTGLLVHQVPNKDA